MIRYIIQPLNLILGEKFMGKIMISTYTQDDMQLKIDVIHAGITKGNKKHKTDFIVENVDDADLLYAMQQIGMDLREELVKDLKEI